MAIRKDFGDGETAREYEISDWDALRLKLAIQLYVGQHGDAPTSEETEDEILGFLDVVSTVMLQLIKPVQHEKPRLVRARKPYTSEYESLVRVRTQDGIVYLTKEKFAQWQRRNVNRSLSRSTGSARKS